MEPFWLQYLFYRWCVNPIIASELNAAGSTSMQFVEQDRQSEVEVSSIGASNHLANEGVSGRDPDPLMVPAEATIAALELRLAAIERDAAYTRRAAPVLVLAAVVGAGSSIVYSAMAVALVLIALGVLASPSFTSVETVPEAPLQASTQKRTAMRATNASPRAATNRTADSSLPQTVGAATPTEPVSAVARMVNEPSSEEEQINEASKAVIDPELPLFEDQLASGATRGPLPMNHVISFSNEKFEGQAALLLRTDPMSPFSAEVFAGKRRRLEIQVQGRFKVLPKGQLYLGGELVGVSRMQLSAMWRGIAWAVLGAVRSLSPGGLHHSFGTANERPHIVSRFMNMAERLVITPDGDVPPTLGKPIAEPDSARKERRRASTHPPIVTDATYVRPKMRRKGRL